MPTLYRPETLRRLRSELSGLLAAAHDLEQRMSVEIESVPAEHRESARNLVHYLAVRRRDIRALQIELGQLGLSSLGRLEAHVCAGLESVLLALCKLADEPYPATLMRQRPIFFHEGDECLARHTQALFGPPRSSEAVVRIMVTLPAEAATDRALARELVAAGLDVARINTAREGPAQWRRMAANVRAAAAEQGRAVRVFLDLAGPKLRTGSVEPGPEVLRIRPARDARGIVREPAVARLVAATRSRSTGRTPQLEIPIDADLLARIEPGDRLSLRDAPGRRRRLDVVGRERAAAIVRLARTTWLESGQGLQVWRNGKLLARGRVGALPPRAGSIELREGEPLLVTADATPGRGARRDSDGAVIEPARVPCTIPAVLREVRAGERILFDDGAIEGVVEQASAAKLAVRITRTAPGGGKLKSDRGINLPDSALTLPSLGARDRRALDTGAAFADLIGLSFVRTTADVEALHAALDEAGYNGTGTIIKIETRRAFEDLPQILLSALRRPPVGVMVARGDLGVEVGFERMAEVQEQILWLCEAAHVPVIWATQVLEGLAKSGVPTRGEVTDAAMSARAECVMLNKGPHTAKAVRFLDDVLARMRDHHIKKTPMLRRLKVSEGRWERSLCRGASRSSQPRHDRRSSRSEP